MPANAEQADIEGSGTGPNRGKTVIGVEVILTVTPKTVPVFGENVMFVIGFFPLFGGSVDFFMAKAYQSFH